MNTTSKEVGQALKEAGVDCESEFWWIDNTLWDQTMISDYQTPKTSPEKTWVQAYTLQELVPVLQSLGRIKGWKKEQCECVCSGIAPCFMCEQYGIQFTGTDWIEQWNKVCELYATKGFQAVDEYILNLLKL